MSYYAKINENNQVADVLVVDSDQGHSWLIDKLGGEWIETTPDGSIRYNFAGIGYTYDPIDDAFIAPMPECGHDELLLNNLKRWECAACEANFMQSRTTA